MASIKISDLRPVNSESYIRELPKEELGIQGGLPIAWGIGILIGGGILLWSKDAY